MSNPALNLISAPVIREMEVHEIDAVAALAARIWRAHYAPAIVSMEQIEYMLTRLCTAGAIRQRLQEQNQRFFLLHVDGALAGYAALEPEGNDAWFLDKLYVDTTLQRKGLGAALLHHAIREIKPAQLDLRVNRKNIQAINFYFRQGFAILALDVLDIGGGFIMDDFLMRKVL